jgi:glycosyltransferase involved in cell wall biosynthesis
MNPSGSVTNVPKTIDVVVPVYNDCELVLGCVEALSDLRPAIAILNCTLNIIFVDDGSTDHSWNKIVEASEEEWIRGIRLSRNYGKEAAILAGIRDSRAEAVIPFDVDLQDPPSVILSLIKEWNAGNKMVVARRTNRESDTFFKRQSAKFFYWFYNIIAENPIPKNVGDFRIIDQSISRNLGHISDSRLFMKEVFAYVGKVDSSVEFTRPKSQRTKEPAQSLEKLLSLAETALISAGPKLFRKILGVTILIDLIILVYASFIAAQWVFGDLPFNGFATLVLLNTFYFVTLLSLLSVIGLVSTHGLSESKKRPSFFIEARTN